MIGDPIRDTLTNDKRSWSSSVKLERGHRTHSRVLRLISAQQCIQTLIHNTNRNSGRCRCSCGAPFFQGSALRRCEVVLVATLCTLETRLSQFKSETKMKNTLSGFCGPAAYVLSVSAREYSSDMCGNEFPPTSCACTRCNKPPATHCFLPLQALATQLAPVQSTIHIV